MKITMLLTLFLSLGIHESSASIGSVLMAGADRLSASGHSLLGRVKRDDDSRLRSKIDGCIRDALGTPYSQEARCVLREMFKAFKVHHKIQCKSCDPYFFCYANAKSKSDCGNHIDVKRASEAVTSCPDMQSSESTDEALSEASEFGRVNGNCSMYLCSAGCKYAANNRTCSAICL